MKFIKKPIVIEAVPWNPDENGNQRIPWPSEFKSCKKFKVDAITLDLLIPTLEGEMRARPGNWIICGIRGEFYPCKNDIFKDSYEMLCGVS